VTAGVLLGLTLAVGLFRVHMDRVTKSKLELAIAKDSGWFEAALKFGLQPEDLPPDDFVITCERAIDSRMHLIASVRGEFPRIPLELRSALDRHLNAQIELVSLKRETFRHIRAWVQRDSDAENSRFSYEGAQRGYRGSALINWVYEHEIAYIQSRADRSLADLKAFWDAYERLVKDEQATVNIASRMGVTIAPTAAQFKEVNRQITDRYRAWFR
jgi:hypothetical protein